MYIQADRLQKNLEALGRIGAVPGGGVNRFAYSKEYAESTKFLRTVMESAGLTVELDPIGNVIGTCPGRTERILLMGSHIDSVPNAGIFDGCLGVLAAVEVMAALKEQGIQLEHTVKVAAWAEEEGNVVVGLLGSGAYVGKMDALPPPTLARLHSAGLDLQDIEASRSSELDKIDASLELHIEQGGILDAEQTQIGVVTGIVGIERYELTILGTKNHAGTTPMELRDDAMVKAAHLIAELDQLARQTDREMVCTTGWLRAEPGVSNIIPGQVTMCVELRAMRTESLHRLRDYILHRFKAGECRLQTTFEQSPVPMAEICKTAISDSARELGLSQRPIHSGAGHDTMMLAQAVPNCGMIFVPSVGGVSHCPQELTRWDDAANGANVLLHTLLTLDQIEKE